MITEDRARAEQRLAELTLPLHVRAALDRGEIWRAKEILFGRLGSSPFTPDHSEQLGLVLLLMHDELEAGRYLFASGRRRPEYVSAIETFLARHGRKTAFELVAALPNKARHLSLSDLSFSVPSWGSSPWSRCSGARSSAKSIGDPQFAREPIPRFQTESARRSAQSTEADEGIPGSP